MIVNFLIFNRHVMLCGSALGIKNIARIYQQRTSVPWYVCENLARFISHSVPLHLLFSFLLIFFFFLLNLAHWNMDNHAKVSTYSKNLMERMTVWITFRGQSQQKLMFQSRVCELGNPNIPSILKANFPRNSLVFKLHLIRIIS